MKLLKLDARHEDARRVARCLMDSPIKSVVGVNYLRGITNYYGIDYMIHHGFVTSCLHVENEIKLPLDTLKFCPFVAMREKVIVKSDYTPCVLNPTTFEVSGLIKKMEFDCDEEHFSIIENGQIFDMCGFEEITLDLTPIERGELEGCEIVEVGE